MLLAYALAKFTDTEVNFYHQDSSNKLPEGVKNYIVNDYDELLDMSEAHGNDVFIFRAVNHEILERIKTRNINGIAWAHNYFSDGSTESLNMNPSVKRVVFVGHEVYDHYIDHPVISKSTFIFNVNFPMSLLLLTQEVYTITKVFMSSPQCGMIY